MPRYEYECTKCSKLYDIVHGYKEEINEMCSEKKCDGHLKRIISKVKIVKTAVSKNKKTGQIVIDTIEETREELKKPIKRKDFEE